MAIYTELPIYKHGCDLLSLALDVQVQMPRVFKRSLGDRIHAQCVSMLEAMAMANASRGDDRVAQLDTLLQHLRATTAMLRVSHDKRLISPKLWAASVELLDALERKDQLLKQALEALTAMQMNAKAVRSGLRICDEAIEAIIKELTALPPETKT